MLFWLWIGLLAVLWFPCCGGEGGITPTEECYGICSGSGKNAACFSIYISGMADDSCTDCESYDGTYITGVPTLTGLGYCEWLFTDSSPTACSVDTLYVAVHYGINFSADYFRVILTQKKGFNVNRYIWENASVGSMNCLDLEDYSVAYLSRTIGIPDSGVSCFNSSAIAEVSTIACVY